MHAFLKPLPRDLEHKKVACAYLNQDPTMATAHIGLRLGIDHLETVAIQTPTRRVIHFHLHSYHTIYTSVELDEPTATIVSFRLTVIPHCNLPGSVRPITCLLLL